MATGEAAGATADLAATLEACVRGAVQRAYDRRSEVVGRHWRWVLIAKPQTGPAAYLRIDGFLLRVQYLTASVRITADGPGRRVEVIQITFAPDASDLYGCPLRAYTELVKRDPELPYPDEADFRIRVATEAEWRSRAAHCRPAGAYLDVGLGPDDGAHWARLIGSILDAADEPPARAHTPPAVPLRRSLRLERSRSASPDA